MQSSQVEALLEAADDGVACDGLRASTSDDGIDLVVDGARYDAISPERVRSLLAERPAYVENWHFWAHGVPAGEDRRAFLRWLEGLGPVPDTDGDGTDVSQQAPDVLAALDGTRTTTWGQLSISIRNDGDGQRTYALRHVDDVSASERSADAPTGDEDLEDHDDPLDARQLAKHDERGRYRPLSTAPTLQRGWRFPALDAADLVRAVECVYPATIPNWYRERTGDLDVTHWRETAERQTGIYDVIEDLPREALEWVAEACCVDSQCLKRREWEYDDADGLAVDGGDGTFPCREPCSLVVAAARQWTILEGETERTYEIDLTPSEKHQLEELIDAVADGRVDEIREADVGEGANRYRARYLRAKRFEDGGLPARTGEEE